MQAYRETVDWMYSNPDALKIYGEYSGLPANIVQRVIKLVPKEALQTDEIKDINGVMADAVAQKFLVGAADAGSDQRADADSEIIAARCRELTRPKLSRTADSRPRRRDRAAGPV